MTAALDGLKKLPNVLIEYENFKKVNDLDEVLHQSLYNDCAIKARHVIH